MYLLANFWDKFLATIKPVHTAILWYVLMAIFFAVGIFLTTYKLTETPPTWMDEGIIIQNARNLWLYGGVVLQNAPGVFESGWYVTTSYTVTFPIAVFFEVFGYSLGVARSVMAIYIVLTIVGVGLLVGALANFYSVSARYMSLVTLALVVTFAPLYGHGKNVLGEVPGIFWLVVSALFGLLSLRKLKIWQQNVFLVLAGCALGLSIATKPIYILAAFACMAGGIAFVLYEWYRMRQFNCSSVVRYTIYILIGSVPPILGWFIHQFGHQSIARAVVEHYANPHHNELGSAIIGNLTLFITEIQPMHTAFFVGIWTIGLVILFVNKKTISLIEFIAWFLSIGTILAFLRTAGYYRYFFSAQIIALIFAALSFDRIGNYLLQTGRSNFIKLGYCIRYALPFFIVGAQMYYLMSYSWIQAYKDSTRSAELNSWAQQLPKDSTVFLYQTPEVATFLGDRDYYQYMKITPALIVGADSSAYIQRGEADYLVLPQGASSTVSALIYAPYIFDKDINRYEIWKLQ